MLAKFIGGYAGAFFLTQVVIFFLHDRSIEWSFLCLFFFCS